jgi:PhzF family phenazine biosynthesis protein
MQTVRFKQVDVFTARPFWGNPVAVVIDPGELGAEEMQRIAAWTNLSETTFVLPASSDRADYRLRIFSPKQELPFAGHPTIGSAHAVIESGFARPRDGTLRQECLAGDLTLTIEKTDRGQNIMVEVPPPRLAQLDDASACLLERALGANTVGRRAARVDVGVVWIIGDLGEAKAVGRVKPDMQGLASLSARAQAAGATVFGAADDGVSALHVRSFAPLQGITEDPVCGSGNAAVAAYLRHYGLVQIYGTEYTSRQGMEVGRDGRVNVRIHGQSIQIGGQAVTCMEGVLRFD